MLSGPPLIGYFDLEKEDVNVLIAKITIHNSNTLNPSKTAAIVSYNVHYATKKYYEIKETAAVLRFSHICCNNCHFLAFKEG